MIDRQSIAYHEAGHATVAHLLDIDVRTATIISADGALGHITHNGMRHHAPGTPEVQDQTERYAMMLIAGCMADRRHLGSPAEGLEGFEGALEDLDRAMGLIKSLMQDEDDEHLLDARMDALDWRVGELLAQHWGAVERVAAGLLERETLSGPEIDELIRQPPLSDATSNPWTGGR
ncbi:MAG: hypothetical protein ACRDK4_06460 [Solirubrobacteraceae bacterium]